MKFILSGLTLKPNNTILLNTNTNIKVLSFFFLITFQWKSILKDYFVFHVTKLFFTIVTVHKTNLSSWFVMHCISVEICFDYVFLYNAWSHKGSCSPTKCWQHRGKSSLCIRPYQNHVVHGLYDFQMCSKTSVRCRQDFFLICCTKWCLNNTN